MVKIKPVIFLFFSGFFFILGVIGNDFFDRPIESQELAAKVSSALEQEMKQADLEAAQLIDHIDDHTRWSAVHNSFFQIDSSGVVAWSKNDFVPDLRIALEPFSLRLLINASGDFLLKKWPLKNRSLLLLVIPLNQNFTIANNYLSPEWNKAIFDFPVEIDEVSSKKGRPVCLAQGGCIFTVSPEALITSEVSHDIVFFIFLISMICITVFFYPDTLEVSRERRLPKCIPRTYSFSKCTSDCTGGA